MGERWRYGLGCVRVYLVDPLSRWLKRKGA